MVRGSSKRNLEDDSETVVGETTRASQDSSSFPAEEPAFFPRFFGALDDSGPF